MLINTLLIKYFKAKIMKSRAERLKTTEPSGFATLWKVGFSGCWQPVKGLWRFCQGQLR